MEPYYSIKNIYKYSKNIVIVHNELRLQRNTRAKGGTYNGRNKK